MTGKADFNKHVLLEHVLEAELIQSKSDIQPEWPDRPWRLNGRIPLPIQRNTLDYSFEYY